jgi:hypothetical protein
VVIRLARRKKMEFSTCEIESKRFVAGSQFCDEKLCYVCKDGNWQEKSTLDIMGEALEKM